ncbi:MAG: hypothetical protein AB7P24_10495 [Nitrospira sp.]
MHLFIQSHKGDESDHWHQGALALAGLLWLILSLSACSSARKEYVVDFVKGNDVTAEGSREHPCQTELQCQTLAERDGVRSYWIVYQ